MKFEDLIKNINQNKLAGCIYQRAGQGKYRDRVSVYRDGKIFFERFCYGEAAGLVFSMWGMLGDEIKWQYEACAHSQKTEVPQKLSGIQAKALLFDGKPVLWEETDELKSDSANGYSRLAMLFGKRYGN
ncbi:MAG: hypothetical protein RSC38_03595 [Oscillospiraceae bacterium]